MCYKLSDCMCYYVKHNQHANAGGLEAYPRNFLKNRCSEIESEGISESKCRVKITVKSRVISNYKQHYGMENMSAIVNIYYA